MSAELKQLLYLHGLQIFGGLQTVNKKTYRFPVTDVKLRTKPCLAKGATTKKAAARAC